jgi:hypothetical protein
MAFFEFQNIGQEVFPGCESMGVFALVIIEAREASLANRIASECDMVESFGSFSADVFCSPVWGEGEAALDWNIIPPYTVVLFADGRIARPGESV